jgi:Flp pilus assembly protein TadG
MCGVPPVFNGQIGATRVTAIQKGRRQKSSAQAMVEAALILPILILLLTGVVDFGRVLYHQEVLANAAREGARAASNASATSTTIETAVITAALPVVLTASNVTITPSGTRTSGSSVTVSASFNLGLITPAMQAILTSYLSGGLIPLGQSASMVVI